MLQNLKCYTTKATPLVMLQKLFVSLQCVKQLNFALWISIIVISE